MEYNIESIIQGGTNLRNRSKIIASTVVLALVVVLVGTAVAAPKGEIVHVSREKKVFAIGVGPDPIARAKPGDILVIETEDCFDNQVRTPEDVIESVNFDRVNPATGPIYIEGAEPGDTLVVDILSIDLAEQGVMVALSGLGVLPDEVKNPTTKILPIKDNRVIWDENFSFFVKPMIGVIGVARGSL